MSYEGGFYKKPSKVYRKRKKRDKSSCNKEIVENQEYLLKECLKRFDMQK
jgi:hypothetical protein